MEKMIMNLEMDCNEVKLNLFDWDFVKSRIVCCLVNRDLNGEILKDCPSMPADIYIKGFGDLAISFRLFVSEDNGQTVFIRVTNELMEQWGKPLTKEFCDMAIENTERKFPLLLESMKDILAEGGIDIGDYVTNTTFVCSNESKSNGATTILYPSFLQSIRAVTDAENVTLIPSSVHEWLILTNSEEAEQDEMNGIIQAVNCEVVAHEEVLSDHSYTISLNC